MFLEVRSIIMTKLRNMLFMRYFKKSLYKVTIGNGEMEDFTTQSNYIL